MFTIRLKSLRWGAGLGGAWLMLVSCPAYAGQWDLSLEGGYTIPQSVMPDFARSQRVFWGSLDYAPRSWYSTGLEGGYLFVSREVSQLSLSEPSVTFEQTMTDAISSVYVGPYLQVQKSLRLFHFYTRAGAGLSVTKETQTSHSNENDFGGVQTIEQTSSAIDHQVHFAMPVCLGVDIDLTTRWRLGAGLRDLLIFRYQPVIVSNGFTRNGNNVAGNFASEDRVLVRHLLMPFGRLSFLFG